MGVWSMKPTEWTFYTILFPYECSVLEFALELFAPVLE